jgi:O-methyltransferase involved in polyketide biosynthesis
VIPVIRFRRERTSGYRGSTAIALARGKTIENQLAQLLLAMLGASCRDRGRRSFCSQRAARAGQDGDADAADPSAFGPDAAKAENALASTGCSATAHSRAERGATSSRNAGAANREAFARAVRRRVAFAAASAAAC